MFNFSVNLTIDYFALKKILGLYSYLPTSLIKHIKLSEAMVTSKDLSMNYIPDFYIPQNSYHDIILPFNQMIQSICYHLIFFPA